MCEIAIALHHCSPNINRRAALQRPRPLLLVLPPHPPPLFTIAHDGANAWRSSLQRKTSVDPARRPRVFSKKNQNPAPPQRRKALVHTPKNLTHPFGFRAGKKSSRYLVRGCPLTPCASHSGLSINDANTVMRLRRMMRATRFISKVTLPDQDLYAPPQSPLILLASPLIATVTVPRD